MHTDEEALEPAVSLREEALRASCPHQAGRAARHLTLTQILVEEVIATAARTATHRPRRPERPVPGFRFLSMKASTAGPSASR